MINDTNNDNNNFHNDYMLYLQVLQNELIVYYVYSLTY